MRRQDVTPHVTQNNNRRRSAIDARTTRHAVYNLSQRMRKRIEEVFGWVKTGGRAAQNTRPRHAACRLDVHAVGGGLRPDPAAEAAGCRGVAADTRRLPKACSAT
jgi:hypothetical protein